MDSASAQTTPTLAQQVAESVDSRDTGLDLARVSRVVTEVASELDTLHARGGVHGNVDASQILAPPRGPARLLSPSNTISSQEVGADVTGLATVAYFALTGEAPSYFHTLSSSSATGGAASPAFLVSPLLRRPDLPPAVGDVLMRGLTAPPADRYASAGAFATAFQEAAHQGVAPPFWTALLANRLFQIGAASAAALVVGVWLAHSLPHSQPSPAAPPAVSASLPPSVSPPSSSVTGASPTAPTLPSQAAPAVRSQSPIPVPSPPPVRPARVRGSRVVPNTALTASKIPALSAVPPVKMATLVPPGSVPHNPLKRPQPRGLPAAVKLSPRQAYVRVYAYQSATIQDALKHRAMWVRARRVFVDGTPSASLTSGRLTSIRPGKHKLAFYPIAGVPFDANPAWWIVVKPHSRRAIQVPLPRHPGGIGGFSRSFGKQKSRPSGIIQRGRRRAADGSDTAGG